MNFKRGRNTPATASAGVEGVATANPENGGGGHQNEEAEIATPLYVVFFLD